jgi:hypothetical protein
MRGSRSSSEDGVATRPGGSLELRAGDRVLLLAEVDDLEMLTRRFSGTQETLDDEPPPVVPSDPSSDHTA